MFVGEIQIKPVYLNEYHMIWPPFHLGLVEFKDEAGLTRALEELDGGLLHGKRIRIERERKFRSRYRKLLNNMLSLSRNLKDYEKKKQIAKLSLC